MLNELNTVVRSKVSDEEVVKNVMEVGNIFELAFGENFLIKCFIDNSSAQPPQSEQKESSHLSVGDGIAATACIAGMGGLLAAPLLLL